MRSSTACNDARKRLGQARWGLGLLGMTLGACYGGGNGPDNPNRDEPVATGRARLWTVTDESGAVLSSGCTGDVASPRVQAKVGDRLVYELVEEVVQKEYAGTSSDWWCNDDALVRRFSAGVVEDLECWGLPSGAPIRVERAEVVPSDWETEPALDSQMKGRGFRLWLEVLEHGALVLAPSSRCNLGSRAILQVTEG
jgi:hypothetical protein